MKRFLFSLFCIAACFPCAFSKSPDFKPSDFVDPLIGTQSSYELSAGNTYPAIALPWGMNFWTPQTGREGDGWQYTYNANKIRGFKQTHQPSPWINDYGQFAIMPVAGKPVFDQDLRASWFSHMSETAKPHYYQVYLSEYDINVEIAPSERAAFFRFSLPEDSVFIIIDAFRDAENLQINPQKRQITGVSTRNSGGVPENFKNFFVVEFDRDFDFSSIPNENVAIAGFKNERRGELLHAKVASSFISNEQALLNLKELDSLSFNQTCDLAKQKWDDTLGRIEVSGLDTPKLRTFYSALYRSLLFPRKFYEIDAHGDTIHYSPYSGEIKPGPLYTDTGFWDTFRALFPLLNFVYPEVNAEIQQGLLNAYNESGFLPEWASPGHRDCMVGNNSASVVADAFLSGIDIPNPHALYNALLHARDNVHPEISSTGRLGHQHYNALGYIPYDCGINESAARTLEYAYNDWCIMRMAQELGRPQSEVDSLRNASQNFRNLFDPETKLMRPRLADGRFAPDFSPLKWGDAFTEGNAWHYTWSVFHDPAALISLMGGDEDFSAMLDSVFNIPPIYDASYYGSVIHEIREMEVMNMGNYAHGNQPAQHMIYLYNYAGMPWNAQEKLRLVMDKLYTDRPDGYCGDEDNGQTSAWYVFSALGFYPVCPGSGQYVIGSPLINNAVIHFDNGNNLNIIAENNSPENVYIREILFNDIPIDASFLLRDDLRRGGTLKFIMDSEPDTSRATSISSRPYSLSPFLSAH